MIGVVSAGRRRLPGSRRRHGRPWRQAAALYAGAVPADPPRSRTLRRIRADAAAVPDLLVALREALRGAGPALLPVADPADPGALDDAVDSVDQAELAPEPGEDPTALAVPTSGSTGARKVALLPASALLASAAATHDRLGGPGRWLLALPPRHVAGLQVLVRSLVAGTTPVVLDLAPGFEPEAFAAAAGRVTGVRRYTALVPTQVSRLLAAGGAAVEALAGFDAVLVGGAATPGPLAERARAAGVRLVTTYGATETCGGCVYDGVPLAGVAVRVGDGPAGDGRPGAEGRVHLGGAVVARGYLGTAAGDSPATDSLVTDSIVTDSLVTDAAGVRWFRTDDLGTWDGTRLTVHGRADDVVVTGGLNVAPRPVEEALLRLPGVAEAVVVGVPDDEWGQRVAAAVVLAAGARPPTLADARALVGAVVAPHAAPRQLAVVPALPLRGPGKPDRAAVAALLAGAGEAGSPDDPEGGR
jgi:O-succinylbenzoic acid--CoA ligase